MSASWLVTLGSFFLACWGLDSVAAPDRRMEIRITTEVEEVEFGVGFRLTVVRIWNQELIPEEWSDDLLSPLVVEAIGTTLREEGSLVEETRRFRCHAFSLTDVTLPAPVFRATPRDGGAEHVVAGHEVTVRVNPSVDRISPGEVEMSLELLPEPFAWSRWLARCAAGLGALTVLAWAVRRRAMRTAPAPTSASLTPSEKALRRLARLRESRGTDDAENQWFYLEVSAAARDYVAEQFEVTTPGMTTEEILAAPRIGVSLPDKEHRQALSRVLIRCDFATYGRDMGDEAERERLLERASTFIRQTCSIDTPPEVETAGRGEVA